jgi:hypothetical protein
VAAGIVTGSDGIGNSIGNKGDSEQGATVNGMSSGAKAAWRMGTAGTRSTAVVEERRTKGKRSEKGEL